MYLDHWSIHKAPTNIENPMRNMQTIYKTTLPNHMRNLHNLKHSKEIKKNEN